MIGRYRINPRTGVYEVLHAQSFGEGDRIEARFAKGDTWLRGRVAEVNGDESYTINYDNGTTEKDVPVDYIVAAVRRVHSSRRSDLHGCCSTVSCTKTVGVVVCVLILCLWIAFFVGASNPKASWSGYDCLVKKWNAEKQYTEVWNAEAGVWQEFKQGRRLFGRADQGKTDTPNSKAHNCKLGGMTLAMLISALVLCCAPLLMLCCTGQLKAHDGGISVGI
jgi:hypothetical protein